MAWGTPTFLAHNKSASAASTHSVVVSGVTAAVGDLVVVAGFCQCAVSSDTFVVSDSAGNTWTTVQQPNTSGAASTSQAFMSWALLTSALSAGSITVEDTSTGGTQFNRCGVTVASVSGATSSTPEDATTRAVGGNAVATTTPSLTSGSPTQADEMMFSVYGTRTPTGSSSIVEDAGWNTLDLNYGDAGVSSRGYSIATAYFENTGTGTKTRTLSTASTAYAMITMGFKVAAGGGGTVLSSYYYNQFIARAAA